MGQLRVDGLEGLAHIGLLLFEMIQALKYQEHFFAQALDGGRHLLDAGFYLGDEMRCALASSHVRVLIKCTPDLMGDLIPVMLGEVA